MSLAFEVTFVTRLCFVRSSLTRSPLFCSALIGILAISGCGGGLAGPQREAFTGTVLREGIEIDTGSITFVPTGGGPAASATIEEGVYKFDKKTGPVAGTHKVEIAQFAQRDFEPGVPKKEAAIIEDTRFKKKMPAGGWVKDAVVEEGQADTIDFEID